MNRLHRRALSVGLLLLLALIVAACGGTPGGELVVPEPDNGGGTGGDTGEPGDSVKNFIEIVIDGETDMRWETDTVTADGDSDITASWSWVDEVYYKLTVIGHKTTEPANKQHRIEIEIIANHDDTSDRDQSMTMSYYPEGDSVPYKMESVRPIGYGDFWVGDKLVRADGEFHEQDFDREAPVRERFEIAVEFKVSDVPEQ